MPNEKKMDCIILGLLSHESLTGYEIKHRIDYSLKFFWSASFGSIYPTLNELHNKGMLIQSKTKENGREKIYYTITEKGCLHLKNWLKLPVEKDELRYETLLKLFFGSEGGEKNSVFHIKNFQTKIKAELSILQTALYNLEKILTLDKTHTHYYLTAKFGALTYQTYLDWCEEAIKLLEKKEDNLK